MALIDDASAEQVIFRATELAVNQRGRFEEWLLTHTDREGWKFYAQPEEIEVTSKISDFLHAAAVMKGLIKPGQPLRSVRPAVKES